MPNHRLLCLTGSSGLLTHYPSLKSATPMTRQFGKITNNFEMHRWRAQRSEFGSRIDLLKRRTRGEKWPRTRTVPFHIRQAAGHDELLRGVGGHAAA